MNAPTTWDDDGARPVEGEHGWVTPLLPNGSQRYPDGTPVEVWHPEYTDRLRSLNYVAGKGYTATFGGGGGSTSWWHWGTLIRPAFQPTVCDREHNDEWVEVAGVVLDDLPEGARVRQEWAMGVEDSDRYLAHRDDLPDPDARTIVTRKLGPEEADTFLGWLDKNGWTVTRKDNDSRL